MYQLIGNKQQTMTRRIIASVLGGIVGGLVMAGAALLVGVLLKAVFGIIPTNVLLQIAAIVKSHSPVVGFALHLVFSSIIGIGFGLVFGPFMSSYKRSIVFGLLYGGIWWVVGTLTALPLLTGQNAMWGVALTLPFLPSLVAHLCYGLVTALIFSSYLSAGGKKQQK
jgi:hypothetical protein